MDEKASVTIMLILILIWIWLWRLKWCTDMNTSQEDLLWAASFFNSLNLRKNSPKYNPIESLHQPYWKLSEETQRTDKKIKRERGFLKIIITCTCTLQDNDIEKQTTQTSTSLTQLDVLTRYDWLLSTPLQVDTSSMLLPSCVKPPC